MLMDLLLAGMVLSFLSILVLVLILLYFSYICKDILQLGPGSANVYFGCAETGKSKGDWEHDGILGMFHKFNSILLQC